MNQLLIEKIVFYLAVIVYLVVVGFLLKWLSQFFWFWVGFKFFLLSLVVVGLKMAVNPWATHPDRRIWVGKAASILVFPFVSYLKIVGYSFGIIGLPFFGPLIMYALNHRT